MLTGGTANAQGNTDINGNLVVNGNEIRINNNTNLLVSNNTDPYTVLISNFEDDTTQDISGRNHTLNYVGSSLSSTQAKHGSKSLKVGYPDDLTIQNNADTSIGFNNLSGIFDFYFTNNYLIARVQTFHPIIVL